MLKKLFFILLPFSIAWGSGFSIYEHGAKSSAMGGAFMAQANDASAVFYNPAGINQLPGKQFYFGTTIIMPQASFQAERNLDPYAYHETESEWFPPSTFFMTVPVVKGLTAGLGIYSLFGLGTDWGEEWIGRTVATNSNVTTFFVNPVLSYQPWDFISIAAGFNLVYGSVTLEKSIYYAPHDVFGISSLDANTYGYGINVGVRVNPVSTLSIGAIYRTNVNLEFTDGDADFTFPSTGSARGDGELRFLYPSLSVGSELELPALMGAGISYTFFNRLTAEVDYLQIGWSSYDELVIDLEDPLGNVTRQKNIRNYEDTHSIRLGLEYNITDHFSFRGGYVQDKKAVPDNYLEPSLPEGDRNIYSLGFGYGFRFENFLDVTIDGAYILLRQDERQITNSVSELNGVYNSLANMYALSIGWTF
jgi:long-chain fatty acid transport protein